MGYRHYIGYIPKDKIPEVMREVQHIKESFGKPITAEDAKKYDAFEGDEYRDYVINHYLRNQAICIAEIGKLYWADQDPIVKVLYDNKKEDFSTEDDEFFFVEDKQFLYHLSVAYMGMYIKILNQYESAVKEIKDQVNKETEDKVKWFNWEDHKDEKINISLSLGALYNLFNMDQHLRELINYNDLYERLKVKQEDEPKPYNDWKLNNAAVEMYQQHKDFDYENNVLCVFAY